MKCYILLFILGRYELHEWVYQLHNSLDEFKKREHGIYSIVSNGPASSPLDILGDNKQQETQQKDQQPQGIYAVVRKSNVKPTRQAPPVPPRSQEMNILTDETPPDSVFESNGERSRELLVSFGSGSDVDYLAQFRKHKRSLSDTLVVIRAIDVGPAAVAVGTDKSKAVSTLKKTSSATNLTNEKTVEKDKGFELPASVVKKKRFNKRRKTIAHSARRRSRSPPSEPPPPPPSGEKPEVNQAIIDALYALDEELGQNVAVLPNDTMPPTVTPIQLEHKTVFATFQSPEAAHGLTSPAIGHVLSPESSDHPQSEVPQHEASNSDVRQQDGLDQSGDDEVDVSHCIKPSAAAGKAKIGEVKANTPQEETSKVKKAPPPVKPKPYKPSPPLRSTSYNRTVELSSNKTSQSPVTATPVSPSSLKPPTAIADVKQNKEGTEQPKKRSPPRVTFPEELEKAINRKSLTTFNLDDLNKEVVERGGMKGSPLSPSKPKNSGASSVSPRNNDSSMLTTSAPVMNNNTEESMTKIFQNWPNHGMSNGSVSDPMSPVHSEPAQWRDSMADQHIYDDPWDRKMRAINMARSQGMKAGDRNSLERRRTFSNGNYVNGSSHMSGGRMGLVDRSFSVDQRSGVTKAPPRRGASIEDLYNKAASMAFTDFRKGASTENLSSLDPSSPLYVYRKALKNHEQQQQQEEKERSYTLPSKGAVAARRRSQQGFIQQHGAQTSVRPRINNNAPSNRMFTTAQNDNRKLNSVPARQQQPMQYQHKMDTQPLQSQPARRPNPTGNYIKTTIPNYRPYVLNTGSRQIPTSEQNGVNMNRKPMVNIFQTAVGMGAEDWRYYQSGTRMSYDKNSDTTILRSLV